MTKRGPRLWVRLFVSYLAVVAVGAVVMITTIRVLVPRLFDDRMHRQQGGIGGQGAGGGQGGPAMRDAVVAALNRSLVVAALASLAVAGLAAWFVTRRIVRPLDRVRATTRALAEGHYHERVDPPAEAELAALAHDVNVLAASLEHTEEHRRHLVTELAHELRTPITTISGFLDGFQDGVIEPTPEAFAELSDEVRRLDRLTADLGLLSRLDEGTLALHHRRVDLGQVAERVVARLRPQFEASDITVSSAGVPVDVDGDPDRLTQIITNVVGNALRYTPAGGRVDVTWGRDGGEAWCTVTDSGRGLSPDELERVFERFARGTAAAGLPGSGVGLTIARSLARAHGGDLLAGSGGSGHGAHFTLRLPAAPAISRGRHVGVA